MTTQHTPGSSTRYLDSALDENDRLRALNAELLAALEELSDEYEGNLDEFGDRAVLKKARAAIAKARA